ncbi:MAG: undecaprenyl-diphosphate phosphatase [Brockia lithotrophica]|nr:undecaprenyl-diphosphate phosphatase [Brockia lithotrophica]
MNIWWTSVLLGLLEGLTEFLPVSSTAHLILAGHALGFVGPLADTFTIAIQLGAVLAVVKLYARRLGSLLAPPYVGSGRLDLGHLFLGVLPAFVFGAVFHDAIKARLFSPRSVVVGLVLGSIFMLVAEGYARRRGGRDARGAEGKALDALTYREALWIGVFQSFALFPGFSRAGATIGGGVLVGLSRTAAAEFSFLLAVPVMLGATVFDLAKSFSVLADGGALVLALGFGTAFASAYAAVRLFVRFVERIGLLPFVVYRFLLAVILLPVVW